MKAGDVVEALAMQTFTDGYAVVRAGDLGTVKATPMPGAEHVNIDWHRSGQTTSYATAELKVLGVTGMHMKIRDLMRMPEDMREATIDFRTVLGDDDYFKVYATDAENSREVMGEGESIESALENLIHWSFN